ncbi:MAG TPA: PBP1A family penicillin-binding protein [Acidimicrobiia bacterium]|nr:PBP1A family penicillin-binding protein [Acidimicrobiia bacterium]
MNPSRRAPQRRGRAHRVHRVRRGAAVAALGALALTGCRYSVALDPLAPSAEASTVVDANGGVITSLDAGEYRVSVALDAMAPAFVEAVVAIEDRRYFDHEGVDTRAIARALRENVRAGEIAEGGSTITQQYVRTVLLGREQTVSRKLQEAMLALELERRLSKEEILERYLNAVYFGDGAYGVEAASQRYFGRAASELDLAQSALLAGLIRRPEGYNPLVHPERALERRNLVLTKMAEYGKIEPAEADAAKATELGLTPKELHGRYLAPHFVEQVKRFVLDNEAFGETPAERRRLLYQGGLRIETTLDPAAQLLAEDAVAKVLVDPAHDPSASVVSIDPRTGHVKAYVGGRDFFGDAPTAKFDLAGQAARQAGSAFKPFVLAAALEDGMPLSTEYDAPGELTIPLPGQPAWVVHNYDGSSQGRLDLVDATVFSSNTVYAQLIMDVGATDVVELAAAMGVRSELQAFPSAALGTNGINALDLASGYATLAADGLHAEPVFVTRVTDARGTVLYEETPQRDRVLDAEIARQVNAVMEQVITRGTGVNARIGRPVAGKTGTGEEWRDAWFVGSTPELTTAVWVGFPDAERSMLPPLTRAKVTGGLWPAQIWALYSGAVLAETPASEFPAPTSEEGGNVKVSALPDVVGMPGERAVELLTDAGYTVVTQNQPNDQYPPGTVLAQFPLARAAVTRDTEVTLTLATKPVRAAVPTVLGLLADEAVAEVEAAGFATDVVIEAEPPPGDTQRAGRAWKQSPAGGTFADETATVTIWVNP